LRITEKDILDRTTETEIINAMSTAPVPAIHNEQIVMPKSIVSDLRWFDENRMKFEDWWRGI